MPQTITPHALSSPPRRWCRSWEGVQNHNAFLLWNICFLSGGRGAPTCSYIFLCCHIAWQFILGSAGWHLRHKADKALGVTSMRPVGAMTMPLAMQRYKMDNTELHIKVGKVGKEASAVCTIPSSQGGSEATRHLRIWAEGSHLRLLSVHQIWAAVMDRSPVLGCFPGSHPMHAGKRSRICISQNRNKWVRQYLGEWKIWKIVKADSRIVLI